MCEGLLVEVWFVRGLRGNVIKCYSFGLEMVFCCDGGTKRLTLSATVSVKLQKNGRLRFQPMAKKSGIVTKTGHQGEWGKAAAMARAVEALNGS